MRATPHLPKDSFGIPEHFRTSKCHGKAEWATIYPLPTLLPVYFLLIIYPESQSSGHSLFGEMVNKDKSSKHWNLFFYPLGLKATAG